MDVRAAQNLSLGCLLLSRTLGCRLGVHGVRRSSTRRRDTLASTLPSGRVLRRAHDSSFVLWRSRILRAISTARILEQGRYFIPEPGIAQTPTRGSRISGTREFPAQRTAAALCQ